MLIEDLYISSSDEDQDETDATYTILPEKTVSDPTPKDSTSNFSIDTIEIQLIQLEEILLNTNNEYSLEGQAKQNEEDNHNSDVVTPKNTAQVAKTETVIYTDRDGEDQLLKTRTHSPLCNPTKSKTNETAHNLIELEDPYEEVPNSETASSWIVIDSFPRTHTTPHWWTTPSEPAPTWNPVTKESYRRRRPYKKFRK